MKAQFEAKMLLLLINSVIDFVFDCIITSVSNIGTGNGNTPINFTTCNTKTTKTCSACGLEKDIVVPQVKYAQSIGNVERNLLLTDRDYVLSSTTSIN